MSQPVHSLTSRFDKEQRGDNSGIPTRVAAELPDTCGQLDEFAVRVAVCATEETHQMYEADRTCSSDEENQCTVVRVWPCLQERQLDEG
jgi:hypothetical protein